MATSRKKAIMDQVEKQRRRNRIITVSAIALIAVIIVAVVIALPKNGNAVLLPAYLDHCVTGTLQYHAHPNVVIAINGSGFQIPSGMGVQGICNKPMHTHDSSGTLHVETDQNQDYTLGDFFLIWGNQENNAQRAIFNSTQIFGAHVVSGHTLTMTISGSADNSFQNYVIPRNAKSGTENCQTPPNCITVDIAITYT